MSPKCHRSVFLSSAGFFVKVCPLDAKITLVDQILISRPLDLTTVHIFDQGFWGSGSVADGRQSLAHRPTRGPMPAQGVSSCAQRRRPATSRKRAQRPPKRSGTSRGDERPKPNQTPHGKSIASGATFIVGCKFPCRMQCLAMVVQLAVMTLPSGWPSARS